MSEPCRETGPMGRRAFLRGVSSVAAATVAFGQVGLAAEGQTPPSAMPSIQLGTHTISRLVAGWNPVDGHSHSTPNLRNAMCEYFTPEKTVEFLAHCERNGITAWQFDYTEKSVAVIRKRREQGTKMRFICLHADRKTDVPIQQVVDDTSPIAMVHHGGATDSLFRSGKSQQVHDFVKKVHDAGMLAGVSAHNPDNIQRIADEGWENDLFMGCFYYVTRPKEEQEKLLGKVAVYEPYFESDPLDMTKVLRQVKQPCLGFKILAAGRLCWSKPSINRAFKFALSNIKPIDGIIVGLFPRYSDEVSEDAECARTFGQPA
jgi:hypothetical protein